MILSIQQKIFPLFFALILFLVLLLNIPALAQTKAFKKINPGLNALYNFNFDTADKLFQEFIESNPQHPAGYYFRSIKNLWIFLDNKSSESLNTFLAYTDTAVTKGELLLEQDSTEIFSNFILGSVYYQRAAAYTRSEEYLSALWNTKMFHYYLRRTLQQDSLFYDAYMGLGLYNFAVSQAPRSWKWALDLSGIEGDRRLGLDYLKKAAAKGTYTKADAEFYLSQLYSEFFLEFRESEKYLKSLNKKFPDNLLFRYALGNLQVKKHNLNSSIKSFQNVIKADDSLFVQLKNYSLLALGDVFYLQNIFDSAKTFYVKFLNSTTDPHLKGISALKTGLCFLFEGDTANALEYFELTDDGNLDLDEDVYAKIRGEQYLEYLPDSTEMSLIKVKNMLDSGQFKAALDSLERLNELMLSDTLRAEIMLYFSDAYYNLKKYKQSLEYAVSLLNFEECEIWVKAFGCYYAARASFAMNSFEDTRLFIEYASNYSNFFFENKLADRLSAILYKLEDFRDK